VGLVGSEALVVLVVEVVEVVEVVGAVGVGWGVLVLLLVSLGRVGHLHR